MNTQNTIRTALLWRLPFFRPQQHPAARKSLRACDTNTESYDVIPRSVFLSDLKQAGEEKVCDIGTRLEIHRQVHIAERMADVYVLLRELDSEWPRFEALYPEAAKDGWLGLLVNRARALRDQIDEASNAGSS